MKRSQKDLWCLTRKTLPVRNVDSLSHVRGISQQKHEHAGWIIPLVIVIVFSLLMRISASSSMKTVLCWIVFSLLSVLPFWDCFTIWTNLNILHPVFSVFFTLSAETLNGTPIFIVSSLRAVLAIPAYGGMLNISAIYFSVMLFVPLCLIFLKIKYLIDLEVP